MLVVSIFEINGRRDHARAYHHLNGCKLFTSVDRCMKFDASATSANAMMIAREEYTRYYTTAEYRASEVNAKYITNISFAQTRIL